MTFLSSFETNVENMNRQSIQPKLTYYMPEKHFIGIVVLLFTYYKAATKKTIKPK